MIGTAITSKQQTWFLASDALHTSPLSQQKILVMGKFEGSYFRSQIRGLERIARSIKYLSFPRAFELKGKSGLQTWLARICKRYNIDILIMDLAAMAYQIEARTITLIRNNGTLVLGTAFDTSTDLQFYLESYAATDGVICTSPLLRFSFDAVGIPSVLYWPTTRIPLEGLDLDARNERDIDVCFVGALKADRKKWLDAIESNGITVTTAGWGSGLNDQDYYQLFGRSKIVLNFNSQSHHPLVNYFNETGQWRSVPTLRNIETAACGALCLSQWVPEIELMFPRDAIDVFSSVEELKDKIEFYLNDSDTRIEVACRGQKHALSKLNNPCDLSQCVETLASTAARDFAQRGRVSRPVIKSSKVYVYGRLIYSAKYAIKFMRSGKFNDCFWLLLDVFKDAAKLNIHIFLVTGHLILKRYFR